MKRLKLIILLFLLFLSACSSSRVKNKENNEPYFTSTPTFYFHGFDGSYKDEQPLIEQAKKEQKSNSIIRINVNAQGKAKIIGKISSNAKNPIVEVNYEDNTQPNFNRNGYFAAQAVKAIVKRYHIKRMNMIGYSLGNISIMYFLLKNRGQKWVPTLQKQVAIGGNFDGAIISELPNAYREPQGLKLNSDGKPNKMNESYRKMMGTRSYYLNHKVKVLNVYGNIGDGTDSIVSNASSGSLQYLVKKGRGTYQTFQIKAPHSKLIRNHQIIRKVINFLW